MIKTCLPGFCYHNVVGYMTMETVCPIPKPMASGLGLRVRTSLMHNKTLQNLSNPLNTALKAYVKEQFYLCCYDILYDLRDIRYGGCHLDKMQLLWKMPITNDNDSL